MSLFKIYIVFGLQAIFEVLSFPNKNLMLWSWTRLTTFIVNEIGNINRFVDLCWNTHRKQSAAHCCYCCCNHVGSSLFKVTHWMVQREIEQCVRLIIDSVPCMSAYLKHFWLRFELWLLWIVVIDIVVLVVIVSVVGVFSNFSLTLVDTVSFSFSVFFLRSFSLLLLFLFSLFHGYVILTD